MRLYVTVNPDIEEETVQMNVRKIGDKVEQIRKIVENGNSKDYVSVIKEDRSYILPIEQISHMVSENGKSFAVSGKEKFQYRETLKYFEENMGNGDFVRISKYCLANINWMDYFEAGFSGNLILKFKNGWKASVSRKYVKKLKEKFN